MSEQNKIKLHVIGDPIEHSKSPIVHGMVMDALSIECDYAKVLVKKGELSEYVKTAIDGGVRGFNLTMPHKVDIIPFLKEEYRRKKGNNKENAEDEYEEVSCFFHHYLIFLPYRNYFQCNFYIFQQARRG